MPLKRTTWLLFLIFAFHAGAVAQDAAPVPCHAESCEDPLANQAPDSQADSGTGLTLAQYKAELDRLIAAADTDEMTPEQARDLNISVPATWNVSVDGKTFEISNVWLKEQLGKLKSGDPEDILSSIYDRLSEMRSAADNFEKSDVDSATAQKTLTSILAREEFKEVRGTSWLDRMKARAVQWLFNLVSRLFGSQAFPTVSRILVWTLVAGALAVLALMIYRVMKNNARIEGVIPKIVPVSAKPWSEWMADARAAAARGEWREAIHLSYWAGVSLLEARGLWKPDRARTPREYLRLLNTTSEFHPTLTQLTRRFEVTWYGYKVADEQAFAQALSELEKLGCR